jgi:hypothetical protein
MSDQPAIYYKIDSSKVTFREYWRSRFSRPRVLIAFLFKILGIRLAAHHSIPWPLRLRDSLINEEDVSPSAKEKLAPILEECKQLGFVILCHQKITNHFAPSDILIVSLLHAKKDIAARIFSLQVVIRKTTQGHVHCFMESWLNNGVFLLTSNSDQKLVLANPPDHDVLRLVNAQPKVLFEAHTKRLEQCAGGSPPRLLHGLEDFERMVDALEESEMRFNIRRGVFAEMTPQEIEAAKK